MKRVEAIIAPYTLDAVRDSLLARGLNGHSVCEVSEGGCDAVHVHHYYRGTPYTFELRPKLKLEIVVRDEDAAPTAHAIVDAVRTSHAGGQVTISPVEDAVRIRTSEHGPAAIHGPVASPVETRWAAQR